MHLRVSSYLGHICTHHSPLHPNGRTATELGQIEIVTTSNEKPVPRWYQELAAKASGGSGGDATDRHAKVREREERAEGWGLVGWLVEVEMDVHRSLTGGCM